MEFFRNACEYMGIYCGPGWQLPAQTASNLPFKRRRSLSTCIFSVIPAIFMATGSSDTGTSPSLTSACFSETREDVAGGEHLVSTEATGEEEEGLEP